MKVIVYVEGKGDVLCLETLLRPLLQAKAASGVSIRFVEMMRGDSKTKLLMTAPTKAALAILNDPQIVVVILPDLYPPNKGFAHSGEADPRLPADGGRPSHPRRGRLSGHW